jgi:hypothetical protein
VAIMMTVLCSMNRRESAMDLEARISIKSLCCAVRGRTNAALQAVHGGICCLPRIRPTRTQKALFQALTTRKEVMSCSKIHIRTILKKPRHVENRIQTNEPNPTVLGKSG